MVKAWLTRPKANQAHVFPNWGAQITRAITRAPTAVTPATLSAGAQSRFQEALAPMASAEGPFRVQIILPMAASEPALSEGSKH